MGRSDMIPGDKTGLGGMVEQGDALAAGENCVRFIAARSVDHDDLQVDILLTTEGGEQLGEIPGAVEVRDNDRDLHGCQDGGRFRMISMFS